MNGNTNQNFQYVMPDDDDEEDYAVEDGGNEMVDMDDDEAQVENDPLQANKVGGLQGNVLMQGGSSADEDQDENS